MDERTDDLKVYRERTSGRAGSLSEDPAAIRAEIDDTRARMSDTLDALGERLNPHVLKERAKETIREATIGRVEHMARNAADRVNETGRSIADTIRENPIPAAMAGIALGWLFWNGRQSASVRNGGSRRYNSLRGYQGYEGYERERPLGEGEYNSDSEPGVIERVRERAGELASTVKEKAGELTDRVTDRAKDVAGKVSEKAHNVADRATEKAHVVADRVTEKAHNVKDRVTEKAQDVAGTVADRSRRGARRVEDMYYENPLAVGAITLAAGFAIAMGAPPTRTETELVGEKRDKLVDKVKEVALDKTEKAQHVAERAIDEGKRVVKQAAREEGLIAS